MRYHYEPRKTYLNRYGKVYKCDHPVYCSCTLYLIGTRGLAVIQQRYDRKTKRTWWTEIDECLVDDLYLSKGFYEFFKKKAAEPINGLYPTITVRKLMWALKLKPLPKERWETTFDRSDI